MLWLAFIHFGLVLVALFNVVFVTGLWSTGQLMRSDKIFLGYVLVLSFVMIFACALAGIEFIRDTEMVQEWLRTQ